MARAATPYPRTASALVGHAAPRLRARGVRRTTPIALRSLRGRPVLLLFFATWCRACRALEPTLEAFVRRVGPRRVTLLALSHESRSRLLRGLHPRPPGYLVAQCTGRTALRYAARSVPTLVLIDGAGVVRGAWQGLDPRRLPGLLRRVEAMSKPSPKP